MAFSKKRVDDRKQWLLDMEPGIHINYDVDDISYDEFVNKELILFSHADNQRSIPHVIDGFKPSQRKVLYSCFKRNLKQEIKVAQLAGYVSEHSAYHHGEASLTQAIIAMAQNFVGCGNINLLTPCGQFGTRLMGGKDAASPRYVFTKLESITRCIFHPDDDPLLEYLNEDGQTIEPTFYVPIIPMLLVNGSEGIGTGWSTSIPTYNPRDIIHNLRAMIQEDGSEVELHPWYRGFTGEVRAKTGRDSHNYVVSGIIQQIDESTVVISELPVGKSTTDYKQFLEGMLVGASDTGFIKEFKENHTDTDVLFTITIAPEKLTEICNENGGLIKKFKIDGSTATSNMHAFDIDSKIVKYGRASDIMNSFYETRVQYYEKRKIHLANKLSEEWEKLDNRVRFILAVVHGELIVSNRKKKDILAELKREGYKMFFPPKKSSTSNNNNNEAEEGNEEDLEAITTSTSSSSSSSSTLDNLDKGYDYLLSMKIWNLTEEKVEELCKERESKRDALDALMRKDPGQLWIEDLDSLEVALDGFENEIENQKLEENAARKKAGKSASRARKGNKSTKKKGGHISDSESDMDESDFEDVKPKSKPKAKTAATKTTTTASTTTTTTTSSAKATTSVKAKSLSITTAKTNNSTVEKVSAVESGLSLAQRLMSRIDLNDQTQSKETAPKKSTTTTATAPKKQTAKKSTKKVEEVEEVDEEDEDDEIEEVTKPTVVRGKSSRAAATNATAATQKVFNLADDTEDDNDNDEDEDSEDLSDDDEEDEEEDDEDDCSESDFSEDSPVKKRKPTALKATATAAATSKATSKTASKTTKKTTTVAKSVEPTTEKQAGKKRQTKTAAPAVTEAFSPGISTPRDTKKPRKQQQQKNATYDRIESLIQNEPSEKVAKKTSKATTTAKTTKSTKSTVETAPKKKEVIPKPPPKTLKTARKIIESSDEENDDEDDDVVFIPHKSPKPVRNTSKTVKRYVVDSDEDDDESEEESESEEEDDDDESVFED